jgi:membrane associated rhomboid family serine protease
MWWAGSEMEGFLMDCQVWERWQLWRGLTSTLLHVDLLHLAFNLYWHWVFGTLVEKVFGHLRFAGIALLLGFTSSLLDFTFDFGGVGLSGVGYGLWAMLWVLEQRDSRFAGAVDRKTNEVFAGWFFLCILLSIADIMPVANIAHAAGALTGALLGLLADSREKVKRAGAVGLSAVMLASVAGATLFWPWTTFSKYAQESTEWAGWEALEQADNTRAKRLLRASARMPGAPARNWFNLGIACQRLGLDEEALTAYEHAARMPDAEANMRDMAKQMKDSLNRP